MFLADKAKDSAAKEKSTKRKTEDRWVSHPVIYMDTVSIMMLITEKRKRRRLKKHQTEARARRDCLLQVCFLLYLRLFLHFNTLRLLNPGDAKVPRSGSKVNDVRRSTESSKASNSSRMPSEGRSTSTDRGKLNEFSHISLRLLFWRKFFYFFFCIISYVISGVDLKIEKSCFKLF